MPYREPLIPRWAQTLPTAELLALKAQLLHEVEAAEAVDDLDLKAAITADISSLVRELRQRMLL